MGFFSSGNSWTNKVKTPRNRTGLIPSGSWTSNANRKSKARKTCPPVTDCGVKQSLMASARDQRLWGVKTKKEVKQAKDRAAKVAKQQKSARARSGGGGWPNKGKYDPRKGKGKK